MTCPYVIFVIPDSIRNLLFSIKSLDPAVKPRDDILLDFVLSLRIVIPNWIWNLPLIDGLRSRS